MDGFVTVDDGLRNAVETNGTAPLEAEGFVTAPVEVDSLVTAPVEEHSFVTVDDGLRNAVETDGFATAPVEAEGFVTVPVEAQGLVTAEADDFIMVEEITVANDNPHSTMQGMGSMDAAHWREEVSHVIEGLGFKVHCTNDDVWHRPAVDSLGNDVNECVTACPDDVLVHALDPAPILLNIDQHLRLKDSRIGPQAQQPLN